MAESRSGDSSLQDRRQKQIGSDSSSSSRTFSGGGCAGISSWYIERTSYAKKVLEKVDKKKVEHLIESAWCFYLLWWTRALKATNSG